MKLINIRDIKIEDLPLIVLVDNRRSWLGWSIKAHSEGNYNHVCEMHKLGMVASQDFCGFREVKIEKYLKPYIQMKFWKPCLYEADKILWLEQIRRNLEKPWFKKMYDYLGIAGHLIKIKWVNIPWLKYCYERVRDNLVSFCDVRLPPQGTPSDINEACKEAEDIEYFGHIILD